MTTKHESAISGHTLKWIAMLTMLCDHFSALVLMPYWGVQGSMFDFSTILSTPPERMGVTYLCFGLRYIGRLAFPIFCFLLTEGLFYTHSRWRYLGRIVAFAAISELPFDLGVFGHFDMRIQNTMWTLAIGLAVCMGMQLVSERAKRRWGFLATLPIFLAGCGVAELFNTDYGASGVVIIALLWLLRSERKWQCLIGVIATAYEYTAPLAFIPIYFYNGKRGRQMKYFFYFFYPVHLLVLATLRIMVT